ncbi:MAG: methylated-DNA--[protein]-cysteine S-methyltransferase [Candidatus Dadabacteria bacterium]|nr:methylated-DNA--[protein]-cysteine S-methyltransferase [Candidatus Dadabacteria bacterium]NIQ13690.1 methylated-DNA--[protein]-cysteine S-methyltransferase [Candidatus Dadabacteria bacterium]
MKIHNISNDYYRVEKALLYITNNYKRQPSLKEIANSVSLSEYHLQRIFKRWAGISPKNFTQYLTKEHVLGVLSKSENILDTIINSDLGSQSRFYDLIVKFDSVTPEEFITSGNNLDIIYGFHETLFGKCLIGISGRGICYLSFVNKNEEENLKELKNKWKNAKLTKNSSATSEIINKIFLIGNKNKEEKPLKLLMKGTNFQLKVWEALVKIPPGLLVSYENVAKMINNPKAVRAVSSAIANNPVAYIIPCHRVIRKIGLTHKYRWGAGRKMAMIGLEQAKI